MRTPKQKKFDTAFKRGDKMLKLLTKNWTMQRIADKYGISRQRVSILLKAQKQRVDKMTKDSILN